MAYENISRNEESLNNNVNGNDAKCNGVWLSMKRNKWKLSVWNINGMKEKPTGVKMALGEIN